MDNVGVVTNGTNLATALSVAVACIGMLILIVSAVEAVRKLRQPAEDDRRSLQAHQDACETRFVRGLVETPVNMRGCVG